MYTMGMNVKFSDFVRHRLCAEDFSSNICIAWTGSPTWIAHNIMVDKALPKTTKPVEASSPTNTKDKIYTRLDKLYLNLDVLAVSKRQRGQNSSFTASEWLSMCITRPVLTPKRTMELTNRLSVH